MHRMPRRPRHATLGALLLAGGLALSGCAGGAAPAASPSASASELTFASDEEAYAAAIAVYEDYVDARNFEYEGREGPAPANYMTGEALVARLAADERNAASDSTLRVSTSAES